MGAEQSTQQGGEAAAAQPSASAAAPADAASQHHPPGTPSALVIVGPSGVGKGTLINKLVEGAHSQFGFSVSHTTRQPRTGEKVTTKFTSSNLDRLQQSILD